jgi:hypothetical protein
MEKTSHIIFLSAALAFASAATGIGLSVYKADKTYTADTTQTATLR